MFEKIFRIFKMLLIALFIAFFIFTMPLWYPGLTPTQTAEILINDRKFGMRAVNMTKVYGDFFLKPLRKVSDDFQKLDNRNAFWVAEVLAHNGSLKSTKLAQELLQKENFLANLVGAVALASQGKLEDVTSPDGVVISTIQQGLKEISSEGNQPVDSAPLELAIIALGYSRQESGLPYLEQILKVRAAPYWVHAYACDSVALIGSGSATSVLRDVLSDEDFYALPNCFKALISLGDKQAIPLAINRISPTLKFHNSGFVVNELKDVTGKNYGYNKAKWVDWWESVEKEWSIPKEFLSKNKGANF